MNLFVILLGLLCGQFSSPSDSCDECESKCERDYKRSNIGVTTTTRIDTIYSELKNANFLIENETRIYKRSICEPISSTSIFDDAKWELSSSSPYLTHFGDSALQKKIYVGIKCDTVFRTFSVNSRFKKVTRFNPRGDWQKFSWEKWLQIEPRYGATTCPCGLQIDSKGKDVYLNGCKQRDLNTKVPIASKTYVMSGGTYSAEYEVNLSHETRNPYYNTESFEINLGSSTFHIILGNDSAYAIATPADTVTIKRINNRKFNDSAYGGDE